MALHTTARLAASENYTFKWVFALLTENPEFPAQNAFVLSWQGEFARRVDLKLI